MFDIMVLFFFRLEQRGPECKTPSFFNLSLCFAVKSRIQVFVHRKLNDGHFCIN